MNSSRIKRIAFVTVIFLAPICSWAIDLEIPGVGKININIPSLQKQDSGGPPAPSEEPEKKIKNGPDGNTGDKKKRMEKQRDDDFSSVGARPVEITNEEPGESPGMGMRRAYSGAPAKKMPGVSYDLAVNCAGLLEIGNLVKTQGHRSDPRLKHVLQPNNSTREISAQQMIASHPKMSTLAFQEADSMRRSLLNKYIDKNIGRYENNLDSLGRDYSRCQGVGLIPG